MVARLLSISLGPQNVAKQMRHLCLELQQQIQAFTTCRAIKIGNDNAREPPPGPEWWGHSRLGERSTQVQLLLLPLLQLLLLLLLLRVPSRQKRESERKEGPSMKQTKHRHQTVKLQTNVIKLFCARK